MSQSICLYPNLVELNYFIPDLHNVSVFFNISSYASTTLNTVQADMSTAVLLMVNSTMFLSEKVTVCPLFYYLCICD